MRLVRTISRARRAVKASSFNDSNQVACSFRNFDGSKVVSFYPRNLLAERFFGGSEHGLAYAFPSVGRRNRIAYLDAVDPDGSGWFATYLENVKSVVW